MPLPRKRIALPTEKHKKKENTLTTIPEYSNETLEIKDEWDTESIVKQITENSPLIIRSKYTGGGKSHIAKHFSKLEFAKQVVNSNPPKIIIGAGDVKQLPPIEDLTSTRKLNF